MITKLTQALLNLGIDVVTPTVLEVLPHDTKAFTQGLAFAQGTLFESTGLKDSSSLRRLDPATGKIDLVKKLLGHWGEGIGIQGEHIVQLTWQSNIAFVYDLVNFTKLDEWSFAGEGWGLAAIGDGYVMTNGSGELIFRNQNFDIVKTVMARRKGLPLRWLNDLEYADGHLFVQRMGDHYLYEIEPISGAVVRLVEVTELSRLAKPRGCEEVLNGVAYDMLTETFFLTGKCWPLLFKVKIPRHNVHYHKASLISWQ